MFLEGRIYRDIIRLLRRVELRRRVGYLIWILMILLGLRVLLGLRILRVLKVLQVLDSTREVSMVKVPQWWRATIIYMAILIAVLQLPREFRIIASRTAK